METAMDLSFLPDAAAHHDFDLYADSRSDAPDLMPTACVIATVARDANVPTHALSSLEETVVALAAFDPRYTIEPPGPIGRLMVLIFGAKHSIKLASDRLEALRRYAVLYRHDRQDVDQQERSAFRYAGFGPAAEAEVRRLLDTLPSR
jgi:hypothetical protein